MRIARIRKRAAARLKGKAGETLAEVLIAMLIAALALTMLASLIHSTASIITESKTKMKAYYASNEKLTIQAADSTEVASNLKPDGSGLAFTLTERKDEDSTKNLISPDDDGDSQDLVVYYINNEVGSKPVVAYRLQTMEESEEVTTP